MHRSERGQMLPLAVFVLAAVMAGIYVLVFAVGTRVDGQIRAQSAADAAALAAVIDHSAESAKVVAKKNGAELRRFEWREGDALVWVSAGQSSAQARARPR